jgi:hypothetical protein
MLLRVAVTVTTDEAKTIQIEAKIMDAGMIEVTDEAGMEAVTGITNVQIDMRDATIMAVQIATGAAAGRKFKITKMG